MPGSTSSGKATRAVRTSAKAAAGKWAVLAPGKPKACAAGLTSALCTSSASRKHQPSTSEPSSEEEVVVVRSMKKRRVARDHDVANNEPDMVNGEGSTEDVVELEEDEGDDNSEEEVSLHSCT